MLKFNGTYEGSLFYGQRFDDSKSVDLLMEKNKIDSNFIVDADNYIVEKLGVLLHNDPEYYFGLKKIRNREIAKKFMFKNTPYFFNTQRGLISQYRMSSGECMLISLLHFIYNSLVRKSLPDAEPILMLIDEIELALHPVAITNLMDLLQNLVDEYDNLTVIITTHSPEVIRKISPSNMYKIERSNENNNFQIVNPCYSSYAIRDVYTHDGYDYLILVEDLLAKRIVQQSINDTGLNKSRLVNVTPVGGWTNVLQLQRELITENILGVGKKVISVLDGDVNGKTGKEYKSQKKIYLPISSVEKYLKEHLVDKPNFQIKKDINDTFFPIDSIDMLITEYKKQEKMYKKQLGEKYKEDNDGKRFYKQLLDNVGKRKITEVQFVDGLYIIIKGYVNTTKFN